MISLMEDAIKGKPLDVLRSGIAVALRLNAPEDVIDSLRRAHVRGALNEPIFKQDDLNEDETAK